MVLIHRPATNSEEHHRADLIREESAPTAASGWSSERQMLAQQALVSGSLAQALFRQDGALRLLDAPDAEPREPSPNEVYLFRHSAREVAWANPSGLPIAVETVHARLDGQFGSSRHRRSARRDGPRLLAEAPATLNPACGGAACPLRERFLISASTQEWDPAGGLAIATEEKAEAAAACYQPLAQGVIDRLADDIAVIVLEKRGSGLEAARAREELLRSGVLAELAGIEARKDRAALHAIFFQRHAFPRLRAADPSGQLVTALLRRIEARFGGLEQRAVSGGKGEQVGRAMEEEETEGSAGPNPILATVERALDNFERGQTSPEFGSPGICQHPTSDHLDWNPVEIRRGRTSRTGHLEAHQASGRALSPRRSLKNAHRNRRLAHKAV